LKKSIKRFPNAKINLGLLIKGKRPDGYHLLETLYFPYFDLQDELEIERLPGNQCHLQVKGIELDGDPTDNLCVKAYRLLQARYPALGGVRISLEKKIPAGAGLGGGSSDAAQTLLGLRELFDLGAGIDELAEIGGTLGADVPFFLYNRPLLARGIGTEFEELALEFPFRIELITPPIHSSTIGAYKALDYRQFDPDRDLKEILLGDVEHWRDRLDNDLEVPVFKMYPELAQIKQDFYDRGAVYAAMSGSGSAVYGLFEK
jgi:4-diphosphocytidyl-2-C-methyl-D-erythritol kinase